jgi:hypothetical protein
MSLFWHTELLLFWKNLYIPMHNGYYNGASYKPKAPLWTSCTFVLEYCMDIQVPKNEKMTHLSHFYFTTYYSIVFTLLSILLHTQMTAIIVPHNDNVNNVLSFSAGKYSV